MTDESDDHTLERTPERKLEALLQRDGISEKTRRVAENALQARREGRL